MPAMRENGPSLFAKQASLSLCNRWHLYAVDELWKVCTIWRRNEKKVELTPWCGGFHKSNNIDASFLLYSAIKSLLIFISLPPMRDVCPNRQSVVRTHTLNSDLFAFHATYDDVAVRFESKTSRTTNDIDGQREITVINWNIKMFEFYIWNIY